MLVSQENKPQITQDSALEGNSILNSLNMDQTIIRQNGTRRKYSSVFPCRVSTVQISIVKGTRSLRLKQSHKARIPLFRQTVVKNYQAYGCSSCWSMIVLWF